MNNLRSLLDCWRSFRVSYFSSQKAFCVFVVFVVVVFVVVAVVVVVVVVVLPLFLGYWRSSSVDLISAVGDFP